MSPIFEEMFPFLYDQKAGKRFADGEEKEIGGSKRRGKVRKILG